MNTIKHNAHTIASAGRRTLAAADRIKPVHAVLLGLCGAVFMLWPADAWPLMLGIAAGALSDAV